MKEKQLMEHDLKTLVGSTTIPATMGNVTLAQAGDTFDGHIDSNFYNWGTDVAGADRPETLVDIYDMKKDGNYRNFLSSLGLTARSPLLTQGQIKEFCRSSRHLLQPARAPNLFPFEANSESFFACVGMVNEKLFLRACRFYYVDVWGAGHSHRLVVPRLAI